MKYLWSIPLLFVSTLAFAETYGALAIDRNSSVVYAWAYDHLSQKAADNFALRECKKFNGSCNIVVRFSGPTCAAYRRLSKTDGSAYGWAISPDLGTAEWEAYQTANHAVAEKHVPTMFGRVIHLLA